MILLLLFSDKLITAYAEFNNWAVLGELSYESCIETTNERRAKFAEPELPELEREARL